MQQIPSQCLLSFEVENSSPMSKTIELTIKPKLDASGAPLPCNFRVPQSSIPCEVSCNSRKTVVRLTKLDHEDQDWGDFEWSFCIREKNNNPYLGSSGAGGAASGGYGATGDYSMQGDTQAAADLDAKKSCPACTFDNDFTATVCDVCGSSL